MARCSATYMASSKLMLAARMISGSVWPSSASASLAHAASAILLLVRRSMCVSLKSGRADAEAPARGWSVDVAAHGERARGVEAPSAPTGLSEARRLEARLRRHPAAGEGRQVVG